MRNLLYRYLKMMTGLATGLVTVVAGVSLVLISSTTAASDASIAVKKPVVEKIVTAADSDSKPFFDNRPFFNNRPFFDDRPFFNRPFFDRRPVFNPFFRPNFFNPFFDEEFEDERFDD